MKKNGIAAVLLISAVFLAGGCASPTPQQEYDNGITMMQKGYAEVAKAAESIDENNRDSALRDLNSAMSDFDKAIDSFAAAELPPGNEAALDALKKGLNTLEQAVKAIEDGKYDEATKYYSEARNDFDVAVSSLK